MAIYDQQFVLYRFFWDNFHNISENWEWSGYLSFPKIRAGLYTIKLFIKFVACLICIDVHIAYITRQFYNYFILTICKKLADRVSCLSGNRILYLGSGLGSAFLMKCFLLQHFVYRSSFTRHIRWFVIKRILFYLNLQTDIHIKTNHKMQKYKLS